MSLCWGQILGGYSLLSFTWQPPAPHSSILGEPRLEPIDKTHQPNK